MFKSGLLATTAFVVVGSLSFVGAQSWANPAASIGGTAPNKNDEFLCTYGQLEVSQKAFEGSSSSFSSAWTHVAIPIVGRGRTVDRIIVREERAHNSYMTEFSASIRSNNALGHPGKLLASGIGKAPTSCQNVEIPIRPTKLDRGTTYWIVETEPYVSDSSLSSYWAANPKSKHKAYARTHRYYNSAYSHASSTSPWTKQSQSVYARVK